MIERTRAASRAVRPEWLARGFAALAAATFGLIVVGSLVRANDAGLACPDWPLCHGQIVPEIDHKIAYELGHRIFAGTISLGLLVLSWGVVRSPELRGRMRRPLVFAWAILITQAVFGGLTVLLLLAPWTVSAHLVLGNAFCVTLLWISRDLAESRDGPDRVRARTVPPPAVRALAGGVAGLLLLQVVLGGMVSSHYAGLACTSFPTCDGESIAPTFQGLVGIQVLHRLNGFALLVLFGVLACATRGLGRMGALSIAGWTAVALQIGLGAANVLLRLPVALTAMHTGLAAAIVLVAAMLIRDVLGARGARDGNAPPARVIQVGRGRVGEVGKVG